MVRIILDRSGIRGDANRDVRPVVVRVTRRVLSRSAILCPVDMGLLRGSGRMKVDEGPLGPRGIVEYTAEYAAAVEKGTRPHEIKARTKKALKFEYQGRTVIVKSVRHPGTNPRPFLRSAAEEVASEEGFRFIRRN